MPPPFPGMDPYIEARREWSDFQISFATELRTHFNMATTANYYAITTASTAWDTLPVAQQKRSSLSHDMKFGQRNPSPTSLSKVTMIDPPTIQSCVPLEIEVRVTNVEVRETGTDRLVTAIEILSPVNKRSGPQHEKYLRKRRELFRADIHVIEIDLLRGGQRSPLEVSPPDAAYCVTLGRAGNRPTVDVWAIQLPERLPRIPIPLLDPEPDVVIDLGAIVSEVYERGAFAKRLDYRAEPPPPALSADDQRWLDTLLAPYREG